jgi:hypothetical protein
MCPLAVAPPPGRRPSTISLNQTGSQRALTRIPWKRCPRRLGVTLPTGCNPNTCKHSLVSRCGNHMDATIGPGQVVRGNKCWSSELQQPQRCTSLRWQPSNSSWKPFHLLLRHRFASKIGHNICDFFFGRCFKTPPLTAVTKYCKDRGPNSHKSGQCTLALALAIGGTCNAMLPSSLVHLYVAANSL